MPKLAAYCTSKFALVGLSDSLRAEYGRYGLGVTALCPGFVRTNLFTSAPLPPSAKSHKIPPRIFSTTPERVAAATVRAIRWNRRLVVVEPSARFLTTLKRLAPGLIDFAMHLGRRKRIARKEAELAASKQRRRAAA
jgi:short-subunit dehydrogenase